VAGESAAAESAARSLRHALRSGAAGGEAAGGGRQPIAASHGARPRHAEAWENWAYFLKTQDRLDEAIVAHEKVAALRPDYARGWYNFGLTLSLVGSGRRGAGMSRAGVGGGAEVCLGFISGRGQALLEQHRVAESVAAYDAGLALDPGRHEARSHRLLALHGVEGLTPEQIFAEHVAYGRAVGQPPARTWPDAVEPHRRLRVAVLSPDLREHSCAYFIEPILRQLDRGAFELYLYHDHFREDATTARLRPLAAVWRNFVGQPGDAVEAAIRVDAPDILIDLAGHTGLTSRLPLFARRLAPVQINYLGYPDTTGVPAMDYRFTDSVADPLGEADNLATEKLGSALPPPPGATRRPATRHPWLRCRRPRRAT